MEKDKFGNEIHLQYERYCVFIGQYYSHTKIITG